MTSSNTVGVANSECITVEPNIVPAVDTLLVDSPMAPEVVAAQANESAGKIEEDLERENKLRPWYKTPSVWWLLPITAVSAMFRASTIAPRTELFIKFACDELRPEYRIDATRWNMPGGDLNVGPIEVPLTYMSLPEQQHPPGNLPKEQVRPGREKPVHSTLLRPDKRCAQDPEVHRAAAKLSAGITSAQGMLSCFTLGWWTQYSDRAGRTRVLGVSALAVLITDALLFLVAFRGTVIPGGYRILILGGAIDGLAGGFSAVVAAGHAYVADCSSPLSRSRIFSFWTGVVYAGAALGPSLGSFINYYSNDLLSTFYICTALHVIYGILVVFIVPESVSVEARAKARELYEADMSRRSQNIWGSLWRLTSFVRPLGVFVPKRPARGRGWRARDYNLTLVGLAAAAVAINTGSYHFKFQYALKTFHWNSVQLGHWLSLVGFWRAVHLSIVLPLILKTLYARRERLAGNVQSDDEKEAHVKEVDLLVVRASLAVDLIGYILLGIVTSQNPFIGATIVLSFAGGFAPSVQSLALALAHPSAHVARRDARAHSKDLPSNAKQEIGRLFGALAVIHALGSQVIGPAIFSATFVASIGVYPRAIFWLSSLVIVLALGALGVVRLEAGGVAKPSTSTEEAPLLA